MSFFSRSGRKSSTEPLSFDGKLLLGFSFVYVALFIWGHRVPMLLELGVTVVLVAAGVLLSLRHRRGTGWRWPGATRLDAANAVFVAVMFGLFLAAPSSWIRT